jgi:hypothetical protein
MFLVRMKERSAMPQAETPASGGCASQGRSLDDCLLAASQAIQSANYLLAGESWHVIETPDFID